MSKQVDIIIDSLKNRPEEWEIINNETIYIPFSKRIGYRIENYGYSLTKTKIKAEKINSQSLAGIYSEIFLSIQNKWVLERAVSEWLERGKK